VKCEPESLIKEIEAASQMRDSHLASFDEQIKRYHQSNYNGFEECDFAPENHEGDYVALMLPKLAFSEPRVRVRCRRPGPGRQEAIALRFGLNQWSADVNLAEVIQEVVRDYLFNYGVYFITVEPQPGTDMDSAARPRWPKVQRLSQRQFLMDPLCGFFRGARWLGHEYAVEKEALIELATQRPDLGWDVGALEDLETTQDFDWRQDVDEAPDREEFRVARLWVPDSYVPGAPGQEEGYHGTIYTIVNGQGTRGVDDWVRTPRPAFCPRWGNYQLAGAYGVPDSPWPLGPLTMCKGRVDELNAHAVAASKAMAEYKRLVLVDASHPQLAQMLKRPDQFVIPIKGLNRDNVIQIEMGGLTAQQIQQLAVLRDRLDRSSGMSDAKRGNVAGGTATENAIADEASSVRIAYLKQRHTQALAKVYQTVGWYMLKDDRIVFDLDEQAAMEMGVQGPAAFVGGAADPTSPIAQESGYTIDPDDMVFTIEPFSMDYVGQGVAKQQFIEAMGLALKMAQVMPTMPYVRWKDMFTKLGDAFNDEDWADFAEPDMAAQMAGLPGALPGQPSPMFAGMLQKGSGGAGDGGMGGDRDMLISSYGGAGRMFGGAASMGRGSGFGGAGAPADMAMAM